MGRIGPIRPMRPIDSSEFVEANCPVEEGDGRELAVLVEGEIASVVRQRDHVNALGGVWLPEPQLSAVAAADAENQPRWMKRHAPARALKSHLWLEQQFSLPRLPVEQHNQRIAYAGESVADVRDTGAGQQTAVGVKCHAANP